MDVDSKSQKDIDSEFLKNYDSQSQYNSKTGPLDVLDSEIQKHSNSEFKKVPSPLNQTPRRISIDSESWSHSETQKNADFESLEFTLSEF